MPIMGGIDLMRIGPPKRSRQRGRTAFETVFEDHPSLADRADPITNFILQLVSKGTRDQVKETGEARPRLTVTMVASSGRAVNHARRLVETYPDEKLAPDPTSNDHLKTLQRWWDEDIVPNLCRTIIETGDDVDAFETAVGYGCTLQATFRARHSHYDLALALGRPRIVTWLLENSAARRFGLGPDSDRGEATVRRSERGYQWAPLHWAAKYGHVDVVKVLLDANADIINAHNFGLQAGDRRGDGDGFTALCLAAKHGHVAVVKVLLDRGAYAGGGGEHPALHGAAANGHVNTLQALLDGGVRVETRDVWRRTALHMGALEGHVNTVQRLLDRGANVNAQDMNGRTSLHKAAKHGYVDVATMLLDRGADVNAMTRYHETPLHFAVEAGHGNIVTVLLDRGANLDARSDEHDDVFGDSVGGDTPLMLALTNSSVVKGVHGALITTESTQHEAVANLLLERGANVNIASPHGETPLRWAILSAKAGWVKKLLDAGANVAFETQGVRPLFYACEFGFSEAVRLLVDRGADVTFVNNYSNTPLHFAAGHTKHQKGGGYDFIGTMEILVENGADVNARNNTGKTPLHLAASEDLWTEVKWLVDHGADVDPRDADGTTPLVWAAIHNNVDLIQDWINAGGRVPDINAQPNDGNTVLHHALEKAWESRHHYEQPAMDFVRWCLENGADPDVPSRYYNNQTVRTMVNTGDWPALKAVFQENQSS